MNGCGTLVEKNCQGKPTVGPLGEQPVSGKVKQCRGATLSQSKFKKKIFLYEGWNFNSVNYLFTTDTK